MGRGMQWPQNNPLFKARAALKFTKGEYKYTVETKGNQTTYSVTDGTRTITLPVYWSFGKGAQTWVLDKDGELLESMVSYYPSIEGLDITTGDESLKPQNLDDAVGRKLRKGEPKDRFGCHASNAVSDGKLNLQALEPGVNCEHCHAGSIAHLVAAVQGQAYETAPPDLRKLTSEDISNFCGQCHRTWETVVRSRWRGTIDVRFQPYRLANSKCFKGTDPESPASPATIRTRTWKHPPLITIQNAWPATDPRVHLCRRMLLVAPRRVLLAQKNALAVTCRR